jgi:hypothetical protein
LSAYNGEITSARDCQTGGENEFERLGGIVGQPHSGKVHGVPALYNSTRSGNSPFTEQQLSLRANISLMRTVGRLVFTVHTRDAVAFVSGCQTAAEFLPMTKT